MLVSQDNSTLTLSAEQAKMVDVVMDGRDVIVDACVGAGKTSTIQAMCKEVGSSQRVLYLTYSKLLKLDAQRRVAHARVQNYHGIVYPSLLNAGINCGISESVATFNNRFKELSATFPRFDVLVVDEYQDINEEYAKLLINIKSLNPLMQTVFVGDLAQKVSANTRLDAAKFARDFCQDAVHLPFTQSFRVGPELGELLSQAWNKPIIGVNTDQVLRSVDPDEALCVLKATDPGDLLCLGKRNGTMSQALNQLESTMPGVFNKDTVYASIRDSDASVTYGGDAAVFTTFDSSKGLERPVCVLYDFVETMWDVRNKFPDADHEVLRNIFLVAASRGKEDVVFVRGKGSPQRRYAPANSPSHIGDIPVRRFVQLPSTVPPVYKRPWWANGCFDFKYAENVEEAFALLATSRLDDGSGLDIDITRTEGLIDLSPVVGHYQEAVFFTDYDAVRELRKNPSPMADLFLSELDGDPWHDSLRLSAVDTEQLRYAAQVKAVIPNVVRDALIARLGSLLPRDCKSQRVLSMDGNVFASRTESTPVTINGVADAVHDDVVYELKFTTELRHPMFLELGLYLVMAGLERGVLWNTRTDERWEVTIPDVQRFMDAVALCVTKQAYRVWHDV